MKSGPLYSVGTSSDMETLVSIVSFKDEEWGSSLVCLVVRILGFHCRGPGSIPGQGTEIPRGVAK